MIDFSLFNKLLKTTWTCKYLDVSNRRKWKEFVELELGKIWWQFKGNLNKADSLKTIPAKSIFFYESY